MRTHGQNSRGYQNFFGTLYFCLPSTGVIDIHNFSAVSAMFPQYPPTCCNFLQFSQKPPISTPPACERAPVPTEWRQYVTYMNAFVLEALQGIVERQLDSLRRQLDRDWLAKNNTQGRLAPQSGMAAGARQLLRAPCTCFILVFLCHRWFLVLVFQKIWGKCQPPKRSIVANSPALYPPVWCFLAKKKVQNHKVKNEYAFCKVLGIDVFYKKFPAR